MPRGLGIRAKNACVCFGDVVALRHASLTILPGEFISIVGDSGGGKTTLLRAIGGLRALSSGSIEFHSASGANWIPGPRDIGFCFQEGRLLPWRSVLANVALPLELEGVASGERLDAARAMLERMRMGGVERRMPSQLSGGMRMRVAMARALVTRPRVLLLDEPFGSLDEVTRLALEDELLSLVRESGATAILVTHAIGEAVVLSDRVAVLRGRPGSLQPAIPISLPSRDDEGRLSVEFASLCAIVQHELRGSQESSV